LSGHNTLKDRLKDPLTETARKVRRNLLAASVVGIVIVKVGLVPNKVSAFGIDFTQANQEALLQLIAAVIAFYSATFLVYVASELTAWNIALRSEQFDSMMSQERNIREYLGDDERGDYFFKHIRRLSVTAQPVFVLRLAIEVAAPMMLAIWSVSLTLGWPA